MHPRLRATTAALLAGAAVAASVSGCQSDATRPGASTRASASTAASASASASASAEPSYGGLPTFLPTLSTQGHQVVDASVKHPALASQGDQVRVQLAEGTVLATVTGPETPGQGLVPEPDATYATWTVDLRGATAPIPLSYHEFVAVDQVGRAYHPRAVQGARPLPRTLRPGQHLTFQMRALMSTGEGVMRWSPDGGLAPVQWDFEVEVD